MRVKKTAVAFVVIVKTHKAVVIKEKVLMSGCIFPANMWLVTFVTERAWLLVFTATPVLAYQKKLWTDTWHLLTDCKLLYGHLSSKANTKQMLA